MRNEENPWKIKSSKEIYSNSWIHLREDQVICPNGKDGIYGVIETRIATGVIAIDDYEQIYLVGQYRYPINQYSWEIIEGGGEKGETPLETIKRELQEEAGLVARDWQPLGGVYHLSNCMSNETAYIFTARGLSHVASNPDDTELLTIKKVTLEQALTMVDNSQITDAISVMALLTLSRKMSLK